MRSSLAMNESQRADDLLQALAAGAAVGEQVPSGMRSSISRGGQALVLAVVVLDQLRATSIGLDTRASPASRRLGVRARSGLVNTIGGLGGSACRQSISRVQRRQRGRPARRPFVGQRRGRCGRCAGPCADHSVAPWRTSRIRRTGDQDADTARDTVGDTAAVCARVVMWFRRDLRLADHPALAAARRRAARRSAVRRRSRCSRSGGRAAPGYMTERCAASIVRWAARWCSATAIRSTWSRGSPPRSARSRCSSAATSARTAAAATRPSPSAAAPTAGA